VQGKVEHAPRLPKGMQHPRFPRIGDHSLPTNLLTPFTRKLPPQDEGESWMSSSQGSTPADGMKQEEDELQATSLGVFASFIVTIFIDDVLRSLYHPFVLQSL
jgi:hypothetical protein